MTVPNDPSIEACLETLRHALGGVAVSLSGPEDDPLETDRRRLVKAISDYVLPRVAEPGRSPVVVVIAGASGVGKSTLLNSLAGAEVTEVSLSRPTTRHPVIWANRRPEDRFWGQFIGRVQDVAGRHVDVVVGDGALASDVILVDTPPLDHDREGREPRVEDLLTLADLCIFVTSASRYADAAPYDFLQSANRQGVPVLFTLNKTPQDPWLTVDLVNDFAARLSRRGLLPSPNPNLIFRLTLDPLSRPHRGLDPSAITPLREELEALADPEFRDEIMRQTTAASLRALTDGGARFTAALRVDARRVATLREAVDQAYGEESTRLGDELRGGALAAIAGRKSFTDAAAELAGIVTRRAGVASGRTAGAWERLAGGPELLARGGGSLYRHGEETPYDAVELIEQWEQDAADDAHVRGGGRASGFTRRRLRRFLWRAALDPSLKAQGSVARRYDVDDVVESARGSLAATITRAMDRDAERFRSLVHEPVPEDHIAAVELALADLADQTHQDLPDLGAEPATTDSVAVVDLAPGLAPAASAPPARPVEMPNA